MAVKEKKETREIPDPLNIVAKPKKEDSSKAEGQEEKEDPSQAEGQTEKTKSEENPSQEEKKIRYRKDGKPRKNNAGRNAVKQPGQFHTTNVDILKENYQFYMANRLAMGGTLAAYINRLISADLEINREKYESITKQIG